MNQRSSDIALAVTVVAGTSLATRVVADASTTGWDSGLTAQLAAILLGPLLGVWLARGGHARLVLVVSLAGLTAILAGTLFTSVTLFGDAARWGVPHLLAGTAFGAVLVHAVAPVARTRRPLAAALAACWGGALLATLLGGAWIVAHTTSRLFVWIGLVAVLASLVPAPFTNVRDRPRDPGAGPLLQLLLGVVVLAAVGPLIQPDRPTHATDLMILYLGLLVLLGFTLYATGRALAPVLAGVALAGVVLVGTAYQLTAQLARVQVKPGYAFATAAALAAAAVVAAALAPARLRRPLLLAGPAVALLGLLAMLDIGGKPRFALWAVTVLAIGAGLTLGAGLPGANRTAVTLAGGLFVASVVIGIKLAQGIRVLNLLTQGTPGSVMLHWFAPCVLTVALAGYAGYRTRKV